MLIPDIMMKETSCDVLLYQAQWNSKVWHAVLFPPLLADNDMEVTDEQVKGGEWQNISWSPCHLNTSIRAHRTWVNSVTFRPDSDLLGLMQQMEFNVCTFGYKLDPSVALQELISLHLALPLAYGYFQTTYSQWQRSGSTFPRSRQRLKARVLLSLLHLGTRPATLR